MTDGILLIDKPQGFTSFDVIAKLRGMTRIKRVGHAGTLDPMATGVLPCLFGTAARLCDILPDETKTYRAKVQFGLVTDTQDVTGAVLKTSGAPLEEAALLSLLPEFTGDIEQLPPMYSAVRINGKRLYDLAREGREVERTPRAITVSDLELVELDTSARTAEFVVTCSKGTYVRTIFHDIGEKLGCGAALSSLCRTASSGWTIDECITLDEAQRLTDEGTILDRLLPVSTAFKTLERMDVGAWQAKMLSNGVALSLEKLKNPPPGKYAVWSGEEFLGLGVVSENARGMKLKKF